MERNFSRIALSMLTLLIGLLIGFGCGQSAKEGAGSAKAAKDPAAAEKIDVTVETEKAGPGEVKRFGSVIGVKRETFDKYIELHKDVWAGVKKMIAGSNIRNYSIYLGELDDGNLYLFSYFEYVGDDFDADMQKMKDDPTTQKWWKETDPLQIPQKNRKEGDQWMTMREVFHQD